MTGLGGAPDDDPTHDGDDTAAAWTTLNAGEALPGVVTPLCWTAWGPAAERALRAAFVDLGALPSNEIRFPDALDERFSGIFHGRFAGNVDMMRRVGDQMPGSSGRAVEEQFFASARTDIPSHRDPWRLPVILAKFPANAWRSHRAVPRLARETFGWWQTSVTPGSTRDLAGAREAFRDAIRRLEHLLRPHIVVSMLAQGTFDQLRRLCAQAGMTGAELRLVRGGDVHEADTIRDLWSVAHDRLSLDAFLARHGFHGPLEGQLHSRSWREDPSPVNALLAGYRSRESFVDASPASAAADEEALMAKLGRGDRLRARLVLRIVRSCMPLREVGRAAFLQAFDVARCMARRIGSALAAQRVLGDAEDVFFLTMDELLSEAPTAGSRDRAVQRRETWKSRHALHLPDSWIGPAQPQRKATPTAERLTRLTGVAASPGVAEGRAIVVLDAADPDALEQGDILVCETTDPSWASLFYLASACVIDVGGAMSHGAIVARELGIPCVINTRVGTTALRSGDRIRVDGGAGTVEILAAGPCDEWPVPGH